MAINTNINTMYAMDRGIDRVVYNTTDQPNLPDNQLLEPAEANSTDLERLLTPASLGDALEETIAKPVITHKNITLPAQFKEVFSSARQTLQDAAAGQPDHEKILKRAARLLGEEEANLDLLQMYRTGLYQG
ncbi:hypothetical protein RY831_16370 [Noviherbaspirillum sp. CPCC 100848]|uniref:Uncharacterized protein n=1 Tax=Noviherbaspirillum album TaxID=3080276 RepID=A0ABU6JAR1_9BURK|nr:hypothetical protein [Noviherbaspirillum sp. CPCC 100848]MEC4720740.1 hypothetical protein [Noviherbaspirillum sp. CPCC 100848]